MLYTIVALVLLATIIQAITRRTFLVKSGKVGQDMLYEVRRRVFRHFQRLSPAFHDEYTSGPGDLPADLRHGRDLRDARDRVRRPGDRRAHPGRRRDPAAHPRREARAGGAGLLPVPALADQLVPQGVLQDLPRHPREGRAGDRAVRRVDARHPRGAGVPPRVAQPGDLRRRQRAVPRRQPAGVPAGRLVHARHQADRQHHHLGGAAVRRLPRLRGRGHRRRARGVPALPAAVLRADAGDLAVLQHLPVRQRRAREAVRRARGAAQRARAGAADPARRGARRRALRAGPLRVRRGLGRAARPRPRGPRGADGGPRGHHRRRQDHDRQAAVPVLRPGRPGGSRSTASTSARSTSRRCGPRS